MKLSEKKQFTNEFDFKVMALCETLRSYDNNFSYPDEIRIPLQKFIDFLDRQVYHDIPTTKDCEIMDEKYFVTVYYKEVL